MNDKLKEILDIPQHLRRDAVTDEVQAMLNAANVMEAQSALITKLQQELAESEDAISQAQWRFEQAEAQLVRVLEWHEVSCYDELPFVIDELREGETALNGEDK